MTEIYPCPGHTGLCKFCKKDGGYPRMVVGMYEVDRVTGEKKIDPCCHACATNLKAGKREYKRTSIS